MCVCVAERRGGGVCGQVRAWNLVCVCALVSCMFVCALIYVCVCACVCMSVCMCVCRGGGEGEGRTKWGDRLRGEDA